MQSSRETGRIRHRRVRGRVGPGVFPFFAALFPLLVLSITEGTAFGQAASLDGKWSATALTASWNVGDWGTACGPKPSGGGEPGGTATVSENGNELVISGVGRTYRTTECWEQFPGLARTGHTAASRSWRTSCKSPAKDPRQAKIVTSVTATDEQIIFDETGAYQFIIQGQNCTASVRRSRFFRRIKAGAASTATATSTAVPTAAPAAREPACGVLGPPSRIELRPSRKLMRPGESFTFRAAVVDAKGCALGIVPAFRLPEDVTGVTLSGTGTVTVGKDAPEADVKLTATVGGRSVESVLQVVSGARFDALLAGGGFDETGASAEAAVTRLESGSVGARSTVIEDDSGRRRTLFVGVVGGAAVLLGILGLVLVRRSRRAPASTRSAPRTTPPPPGPALAVPRGTFCPTCREEYAPEAQFCPTDGNRLVPIQQATNPLSSGSVCPVCGQGFDPGITICPKHDEPLVPPAVYAARNAPAPVVTRKICPVCGTQFGGESQFCGQCGASLVPVN